jgi:hypothetical protein
LSLTAVALALASAGAQAATAKFTLVREGQPAATIVVSKTAGHIPWFAAGELQYHVKKITGATLPSFRCNWSKAVPRRIRSGRR